MSNDNSTTNTAQDFLSRFGGGTGSSLESAGESAPDLSAERLERSVESLTALMDRLDGGALDKAAREKLVNGARAGLTKLSQEGAATHVTSDEANALEAIILADGSRPVLFVQDNNIDVNSPDLGNWEEFTLLKQAGIRSVVRSVCRINDPSGGLGYQGTGFVLDDGLVVTNRHVLEAIGLQRANDWLLRSDVTVDFGHEFERSTTNSYAITGVRYAGPNRILGTVNFANLDLAVLETETGPDFPQKIDRFPSSNAINSGDRMYICGFPAKPLSEDPTVLEQLFRDTFNFKRWAPGRVTSLPGTLSGDAASWVLGHDATTLGGNSGSVVVNFDGKGTIAIALHFGGLPRSVNYAHDIRKLNEILDAL